MAMKSLLMRAHQRGVGVTPGKIFWAKISKGEMVKIYPLDFWWKFRSSIFSM
jgi:hypothetical protein